jgi:hypothetical protein
MRLTGLTTNYSSRQQLTSNIRSTSPGFSAQVSFSCRQFPLRPPARRLIPRASAVGAAGVGAEIMIILNPQMTPAGLSSLTIIAYAR